MAMFIDKTAYNVALKRFYEATTGKLVNEDDEDEYDKYDEFKCEFINKMVKSDATNAYALAEELNYSPEATALLDLLLRNKHSDTVYVYYDNTDKKRKISIKQYTAGEENPDDAETDNED